MLDKLTLWFLQAPRRLVVAGLWMFFAGAAALLMALLAQTFHAVPAWFVPDGAAGYTAAASLVCWGVWAMGAGGRLARARRHG